MRSTGIITEYNPFHNGHQYHIEQTRQTTNCDVLIAVMSGHFVQRGEAAIIDKWKRSACALQHGVDLVLEIPFPYVVQSSDHFAYGAVKSLQLAGVDHIVFGSETNDITMLYQQLQNYDQKAIDTLYQQGHALPYAYAQQQALQSNDMLGISYLKALKDTDITPLTIERTNQYHDTSLSSAISSASAIRQGVYQKHDVSHTTCMHEELNDIHCMEHYYPTIQTLLMTLSPTYLKTLFLMDEGIEYRLIKNAKTCITYEDFITACATKRYTKSRIQRTIIHVLNQTTKAEINRLSPLNYIRTLAFNDIGKQYLSSLRKSDILIASRFNQIPKDYRELTYRSCSVYGIPLSVKQRKEIMEAELQAPIYLAS